MSYEQLVRERHAFEDRLRNYLHLLSVLNARELEVALSRLADMLTHMGDVPAVRIRGEVLKRYMELRAVGERRERPMKRMFFRAVAGMPPFDGRIDKYSGDWIIRSVANFPLLVDGQIAPPASSTAATFDETILLLSS
jgi:hypothetical protein